MKTLKYLILFSVITYSFTGCIAPSLSSYEPPYALEATKGIVDEGTAELALTGLYAQFRKNDGEGMPYMFFVPEAMGAYCDPAYYDFYIRKDPQYVGMCNNSPVASGNNFFLNGIYTGMYKLVNKANWIVQEVSKIDATSFSRVERKNEIIAEARMMRALGYFYLLRLYGEFYDVNSEYGLDIRKTPAMDATPYPRKSVGEVYDFILEDLEYGISDGPTVSARYFTNIGFAKGMKAKVLLYMGRYAEAKAAAKDLIDKHSNNFSLCSTASIFLPHTSRAIYDSPEVLFGTHSGDDRELEALAYGSCANYFIDGINANYEALIKGSTVIGGRTFLHDGGERISMLIPSYMGPGIFSTQKFLDSWEGYEMIYHLRMSEVYLILAEASARAAGAVDTDALNALNDLRTARGATNNGGDGFEIYPAGLDLNIFLELVRKEKAIELILEGGESWFDLVRYDYADGFDKGFKASDIKPTATDYHKFIFPIPQKSLDVSEGIIKQNPSYL